ncbi:E3 ubiquitin-protein ligase APD1 isoform X3 [Eucalyptus grandis]|nr:E3 ubiquitin-protein ligase APD1 isoform X3 [Eucalyptus grandis]
MVIGPSSSRLITASSLFVDRVEVRDEARKGVSVYGFSEKPQLSYETNWTASNYLIVGSYNRKMGSYAAVQGFNLWLNRGSKIRMRWEAQTSHLNQLQVALIKGELKYETLQPSFSSSPDEAALKEPINFKEAEYYIEEDDKYYVKVVNANSRSIIMSMSMNVSSKIYDTTKAKIMCSTLQGSCQLKLLFPNTQYVVVTTPSNGDLGDWYIELSFVARVITYIAILGFIVIVIFLILKYLGVCDGENEDHVDDTPTFSVQEVTETAPMMPEKSSRPTYGTNEEEDDDGGSSSSSSEDLYDAKLCVICYDDQRNCFFVPCGHRTTCYDCAQRIMEGESKVCPICRRLIRKVRRLFSP